tara:strand:+ start:278 stop:1198 length:921 start_codon:yes stop_codon:yes gene_type:complete
MSEKINLNDSIDLSKIFSLIWEVKTKLLIIWIVSAFFFALISLTISNKYQSTSTLTLTEDTTGNLNSLTSQVSNLADIAGISVTSKNVDKAAMAIEIIKSEAFFHELLKNEDIFLKIAAVKGWNQSENKLVYDKKIYDEKNRKWANTDRFSVNGKPSIQATHNKFLKENFSISKDDKTGLVRINFKHYSPYVSKEVLQEIISKINSTLKEKDIKSAQNSISFLKKELKSANLGDLKIAINRIIAKQIETIALANSSTEYYFKILSPPMFPENKISPNRTLLVILLSMATLFISILFFIIKNYKKNI